jgi:hypothetical protein
MATVAKKGIARSDCAERILKIVHELQQQVEDREIEFQHRLETIEETQRRVEDQLRADSERAVSEAQAAIRNEVTEKLLSRFDVEICSLQTDFDRRLGEAIEAAESAAQFRLEDNQQLLARLEEQARTEANEWRAEKQRFLEQIASLERAVDIANGRHAETSDHCKEVERKLQDAVLEKAQLVVDLQRVVAALNAQAQSKAPDDSDRAVRADVARIVQCEMARVQLLCDNIEKKLADSSIDLAAEIRLNRERSEFQAYLKGLRYSLGEVTVQPSAAKDALQCL